MQDAKVELHDETTPADDLEEEVKDELVKASIDELVARDPAEDVLEDMDKKNSDLEYQEQVLQELETLRDKVQALHQTTNLMEQNRLRLEQEVAQSEKNELIAYRENQQLRALLQRSQNRVQELQSGSGSARGAS